jgi:hypothetical protein
MHRFCVEQQVESRSAESEGRMRQLQLAVGTREVEVEARAEEVRLRDRDVVARAAVVEQREQVPCRFRNALRCVSGGATNRAPCRAVCAGVGGEDDGGGVALCCGIRRRGRA